MKEKGAKKMNPDAVTVGDCIDMYEKKGLCLELLRGKVAGFRAETDQIKMILVGRAGKATNSEACEYLHRYKYQRP